MRSDIVPGAIFPDYELPDHTSTPRLAGSKVKKQGLNSLNFVVYNGGVRYWLIMRNPPNDLASFNRAYAEQRFYFLTARSFRQRRDIYFSMRARQSRVSSTGESEPLRIC
jgi:hypothetical protein